MTLHAPRRRRTAGWCSTRGMSTHAHVARRAVWHIIPAPQHTHDTTRQPSTGRRESRGPYSVKNVYFSRFGASWWGVVGRLRGRLFWNHGFETSHEAPRVSLASGTRWGRGFCPARAARNPSSPDRRATKPYSSLLCHCAYDHKHQHHTPLSFGYHLLDAAEAETYSQYKNRRYRRGAFTLLVAASCTHTAHCGDGTAS